MPLTAWTAPEVTRRPRTVSDVGSGILARSLAQVGVDDPAVLPHLGGRAFGDGLSELEDHDSAAELVDEVDLVLHQENGGAGGVHLPDVQPAE